MNTRILQAWSASLCRWNFRSGLSWAYGLTCLTICLTIFVAMPASAQSMAAGERVGRVAGVVGAAQVWDAQVRQWTPLMVNRPLSAGVRIRSEREARVRVEVGSLVAVSYTHMTLPTYTDG